MRGLWGLVAAVVVVLLGAGILIGFASRPPARVWTFQYKVVGTEDWREWRLYPNFTDCEQARRFMKNLEDGQRRRLVETHHCSERENPALHQSPGPPSRRR
ncbi:MAG: hypothetical protein DMD80_09415 [Candidatus Rokuibacteriota bacterium]|nr:MAG: hypothetical protein DMD80_09415 [Candidatus Rokubacteria bacterium]PYN27745.1 MAG: hypothetical protein DMD76_07155 [Candidatus Rokubacteria bacterium]